MKNIFDDDEALLDYDAMDPYASLRIAEQGYAEVWPPPGGDSLMHDQFERRAREIQRQPNNLQPVSIVPSKNGPWSANNQLGNELAFSPAANNRQTILKMDEWMFPQVWTVQLGLTFNNGTNAFFRVIASVKAGVGGTTQTFEVDWNQGTVFSCVFNALNVEALYDDATQPPSDLRLSVQIGKRSLSAARPTRSFLINPGGLVGIQQIRIPKFAQSFRMMPIANTSPFAASQHYQFAMNDVGTPNVVGEIVGTDLSATTSVPVPAGANFLNYSAAPALNATEALAIFELGL